METFYDLFRFLQALAEAVWKIKKKKKATDPQGREGLQWL